MVVIIGPSGGFEFFGHGFITCEYRSNFQMNENNVLISTPSDEGANHSGGRIE